MKSARSKKHPIIFQIQMDRMNRGASLKDVRAEEVSLYKLTVAELKAMLKQERAAA